MAGTRRSSINGIENPLSKEFRDDDDDDALRRTRSNFIWRAASPLYPDNPEDEAPQVGKSSIVSIDDLNIIFGRCEGRKGALTNTQ
jgi:hypothetical protein